MFQTSKAFSGKYIYSLKRERDKACFWVQILALWKLYDLGIHLFGLVFFAAKSVGLDCDSGSQP